jgi:NTE family protein
MIDPSPTSESIDGLARPVDFAARYGDGLHLGLSLGGGGIFFVAWQVAYLFELDKQGVDLRGADRVVGTSAGSVVASILGADHLSRFERTVGFFSRVPKLVAMLAPAGSLEPSQQHALELFNGAQSADVDTIRMIGHAALAARTPSASMMDRNVGMMLLSRKWPSSVLHVTCVDTLTGERCVVTADSGVRISRAVAASSAVPGLFSPQPILDRRCMDGGVSGSGTHLDLLAGADRMVVLSLHDGSIADVGAMTQAPGTFAIELDHARNSGSQVLVRSPETMDLTKLMDPHAVPEAIAMGRHQAIADAEELREFIA